jgi:uncharacterized protein YecE (DUF72 family)
MQVQAGTSGYNYAEWRGRFYPERLPAARMLAFYAERFSTVEINATFYRMPTPRLAESWAGQVPETFTFSLKAPRRITHDRRLKDCADAVRGFCEAASALGPRLAVLLFQLPPNFKADLDRLRTFLDLLPPGARAAFEFRHPSWWDEAVYSALRERKVALCVADSEERHTPLVPTAPFGYLRLRDEGYSEHDLTRWVDRIRAQPGWREAFVYFKHEDEGRGPEFAASFMAALASSGSALVSCSAAEAEEAAGGSGEEEIGSDPV